MSRSLTVTIIRREEEPWTIPEIDSFCRLDQPMSGHPKHPKVIMVLGKHTREDVASALGSHNFEIEILSDISLDDPRLPFRPSFV